MARNFGTEMTPAGAVYLGLAHDFGVDLSQRFHDPTMHDFAKFQADIGAANSQRPLRPVTAKGVVKTTLDRLERADLFRHYGPKMLDSIATAITNSVSPEVQKLSPDSRARIAFDAIVYLGKLGSTGGGLQHV